MSEWQPIDTAPRDGTEIVVYTADLDAMGVAWWEHGQWTVGESGWEPTHWIPVPPPPRK